MKLSIQWLTGMALLALFAVLAIGTLSTVEVVDSDQEVATAIDVADFSVDAPVVSIEQSTDQGASVNDIATTSDHLVTTDFVVPDDPVSRLTATTLDFSPDLSGRGDGGIL